MLQTSTKPIFRILLEDQAHGQPWEDLLLRHLPELIAQDQIVKRAQILPRQVCHCDLNEENVLVDADGRVVVLDWDSCGPLAAAHEVAAVLVNPLICFDPAAFISRYREEGGTFEPNGLEVFGSAIAANNNYLAKMICRAIEGDAWAHSELLPMLKAPIRIAVLEQLLGTVRSHP